MNTFEFSKYLKKLLVMSVMLAPLPAFCAATGTISVLLIQSNSPDRLFVSYTGTDPNQATCGVNGSKILDTSTSTGKGMYALLLSAHLTGASVTLYGTGACDLWPAPNGVETLRAVVLN